MYTHVFWFKDENNLDIIFKLSKSTIDKNNFEQEKFQRLNNASCYLISIQFSILDGKSAKK